jgi:vacuole morphology and inheritance protein 14
MDIILSAQIIRGLNDKIYDKRKIAALEVEKCFHLRRISKEYVNSKQYAKLDQLIQFLVADFVYSPFSNTRNGGLIGLAAVGISLGQVVEY